MRSASLTSGTSNRQDVFARILEPGGEARPAPAPRASRPRDDPSLLVISGGNPSFARSEGRDRAQDEQAAFWRERIRLAASSTPVRAIHTTSATKRRVTAAPPPRRRVPQTSARSLCLPPSDVPGPCRRPPLLLGRTLADFSMTLRGSPPIGDHRDTILGAWLHRGYRLAPSVPTKRGPTSQPPVGPHDFLERETGFEPVTLSLGRAEDDEEDR